MLRVAAPKKKLSSSYDPHITLVRAFTVALFWCTLEREIEQRFQQASEPVSRRGGPHVASKEGRGKCPISKKKF
jgi:hypothetical protein